MGAREEILGALRRAAPPETRLPDLSRLGIELAEPAERFAESVHGVGGSCLRVPDRPAAHRAAIELPVYQEASKIVSLAPGIGEGNVDLAGVSDPHQLAGLDLAILDGEFGVAENGAVWVDGDRLPHRAVYVICEHLVLVVSAAELVNDMHQAYARLGNRGRGLFIAGPSKTADIEQALVIGAHGARSATVLLVG